jgi:hypothetical protein
VDFDPARVPFRFSARVGLGRVLAWLAIGTLLGALLSIVGVAVIAAFNVFYWLPIRGESPPRSKRSIRIPCATPISASGINSAGQRRLASGAATRAAGPLADDLDSSDQSANKGTSHRSGPMRSFARVGRASPGRVRTGPRQGYAAARAISEVVERLTTTFPNTPAHEVTRAVQEARPEFDRSPIRDFVPLFVERSAKRPVLQNDHSPIVECSLFTAESVQFSSAADRGHRSVVADGSDSVGRP